MIESLVIYIYFCLTLLYRVHLNVHLLYYLKSLRNRQQAKDITCQPVLFSLLKHAALSNPKLENQVAGGKSGKMRGLCFIMQQETQVCLHHSASKHLPWAVAQL